MPARFLNRRFFRFEGFAVSLSAFFPSMSKLIPWKANKYKSIDFFCYSNWYIFQTSGWLSSIRVWNDGFLMVNAYVFFQFCSLQRAPESQKVSKSAICNGFWMFKVCVSSICLQKSTIWFPSIKVGSFENNSPKFVTQILGKYENFGVLFKISLKLFSVHAVFFPKLCLMS